jgi:hypothetical protein
MLWTSHNNKPFEKASKILSKWARSPLMDSIRDTLPLLFKRIRALSVPTKYEVIDVSAKNLNSLDGDCLRVLILTTLVPADRFLLLRLIVRSTVSSGPYACAGCLIHDCAVYRLLLRKLLYSPLLRIKKVSMIKDIWSQALLCMSAVHWRHRNLQPGVSLACLRRTCKYAAERESEACVYHVMGFKQTCRWKVAALFESSALSPMMVVFHGQGLGDCCVEVRT